MRHSNRNPNLVVVVLVDGEFRQLVILQAVGIRKVDLLLPSAQHGHRIQIPQTQIERKMKRKTERSDAGYH
jgi:hypothetical protein